MAAKGAVLIKALPRSRSKISQIRLIGQRESPGISLQLCALLLETVEFAVPKVKKLEMVSF